MLTVEIIVTANQAGVRRIYVWDAPTRVFHWTPAILVVVAWFTGEGEGSAAAVHRLAGAAIAGLLTFRIIWGFIGGEHARFADFDKRVEALANWAHSMAYTKC